LFKALIGDTLHKITHWAFRGSEEELWERWDREFKELKGKISSSPKFIPIPLKKVNYVGVRKKQNLVQ